MKHLLLLTSNYPDQDSVNSISENIYLSYAKIKNVTTQKYVCDSGKIPSIEKFHYLIVIHPMVLRTFEFKKIIESTPLNTKIIFHVFGDYVRKSSLYLIHNDLLNGRNLTFITASRAYKHLVDKSISNGYSEIIPFPVDSKKFYHSSKLRSEFRKQHQIEERQKVLMYSGRISPQKNIHLLLESFSQLKKSNDNLVLFIIGSIDDFEMPTFAEKNYSPGEYYYE